MKVSNGIEVEKWHATFKIDALVSMIERGAGRKKDL
jgi:hypothetical protein